MNMKNLLMYAALAIVFCSAVYAVDSGSDVCIVVDFRNGEVKTECVSAPLGASGYEVLEASSFSIDWSNKGKYGHALCSIDGVGNAVFGEACSWGDSYWSFNLMSRKGWEHLPVGFDAGDVCWNGNPNSWDGHYCASDGDLIGLVWGSGQLPLMLRVNDVTIEVDGDKDSGADSDGGTVDNILPGSEVEIEVEIENLYSRDVDVELVEVSLEGIIYDIDDGDNFEEESDEEDIGAGKSKKLGISFSIPLLVEDDEYDLELVIKAEDSRGGEYEQLIRYKIEVEKPDHEVVIRKALLSSEQVSCGRDVVLDLSVINLGAEDEDVTVLIRSAELGLNREIEFDLDSDPFGGRSILSSTVEIPTMDAPYLGSYPISVRAIYDSGAEHDERLLNLDIVRCDEDGNAADSAITKQKGSQTGGRKAPVVVKEKSQGSSQWAKTTGSAVSDAKKSGVGQDLQSLFDGDVPFNGVMVGGLVFGLLAIIVIVIVAVARLI